MMGTIQKENNFSDYNCTREFRLPHITQARCQLIDAVIAQVFSDLTYAFSFIAIVTNAIKVITTVRAVCTWTTTQIYLVNLAAAHIIFLLSCPVWGMYLSQQYDWHLGKYACATMNFTSVLGHCGSILFVCVICADRMVTIYFPAVSLQYKNITFGKMVVMASWALSIAMATLSYMYTAFLTYGGSKKFCGSLHVSNFPNLMSIRALILFTTPNITIPFFILVPCYTKIVMYLLCQKNRLPFDMGRAVKLDVVYISLFIGLCLSSSYLLLIVFLVYMTSSACDNECTWANIINVSNEIFRLMAVCNAMISPLVYISKAKLGSCTKPCICFNFSGQSHDCSPSAPEGVSTVQLVYVSCVTEESKIN